MAVSNRPPISHSRRGFVIDGQPSFLLIGSAFYFRMDPGDWKDRLKMLKACRFNAADVYMPWNFHEPQEGRFDFSGRADIVRYLELCQELGLYVYLRPGPYICNECDGGGLPAWLNVKPGLRLRQNEAQYLGYVERYLHEVNERVRPFLYTNGGPIVMYAIENELDFFHCEDPHGYMSALRDMVKADGIDVPITACIGERTQIFRATGLAEDVIPSPNIYTGKNVERMASHTWRTLRAHRFADGTPMHDQPMLVTEMGRNQRSLRRITAGGFNGLGPFNFFGGSQPGRYHGVNNWGDLTYISSTVDFGGMVSFNGTPTEHFFDARRFAGMIQAFETQWLDTEPTSSWDGGPVCDNPKLGVHEDEAEHGRVYSRVTLNEQSGFVFLHNSTDEPQVGKVRFRRGQDAFPRQSELAVSSGYDHIVAVGLSLSHVGLSMRLDYSTAEVCGLARTESGVVMRVCGEPGTQGEIAISLDSETAVVVVGFDGERVELSCAGEVLIVETLSRGDAGREGLGELPRMGEAGSLLGGDWTQAAVTPPTMGEPQAGDLLPLESLGVLQGAGWYDLTFETTTEASAIMLGSASDLVSAWLDGEPLGTFRATGESLALRPKAGVPAGRHTLMLRCEIWGHPNFDDARWPACRIGSTRGLAGPVSLDDEPVAFTWRFVAESDALPEEGEPVDRLTVGQGEQVAWSRTLDAAAGGAVLHLAGEHCHGDIWLEGELVGRYAFGLGIKFTGGPSDKFYLPGRLLKAGAKLVIVAHGTGESGGITDATLTPRVMPG